MAQTAQQVRMPLVDDITVKDTVADTCVGVSVTSGNVHITFATITSDYTIDPAPSRRIVSSRLVMPISGIMEFCDILNKVIDTLGERGVITPKPTAATIIIPPGRPN